MSDDGCRDTRSVMTTWRLIIKPQRVTCLRMPSNALSAMFMSALEVLNYAKEELDKALKLKGYTSIQKCGG